MQRFYSSLRRFQPYIAGLLLCILAFSLLFLQVIEPPVRASLLTSHKLKTTIPGILQLDRRLPVVTYNAHNTTNNVNAKLGSRFDFVISPGMNAVHSGTDGLFHDNSASYIVGIVPSGEHTTSIFHMGTAKALLGDTYLLNQRWTLGLDTSRWEGDATDNSGLHVTVDFIDTFLGEPGCSFITYCAGAVRDDTVPVLLAGVSLQNPGTKALSGDFVLGSNRSLPTNNACVEHTTPAVASVNVLYITGDSTLLTANNNRNMALIDAGMYYQGLKEAAAYRAAAYLDGLVPGGNNGDTWKNAASKIENAIAQAYTNCNGRTVVLGDGLFYLHLIRLGTTMNRTLLQDMAKQYPADLSANIISSPDMISLESTRARGSQCTANVCPRYEWFSKVILTGIVADMVYVTYGCTSCIAVA